MTSRLIIMLQYSRQHGIGTWIDQWTEQNWKIGTQKSSQLSFVWQRCKYNTFPVLHCILTLFQPDPCSSPFTGVKTGLCLKFSSYSSSLTFYASQISFQYISCFLAFSPLKTWTDDSPCNCVLVVNNHILNIQLNKFLIL